MKLSHALMSGIFVVAGLDAVKEPGGRVDITRQFFSDCGIIIDREQADMLVKLNGAAMVGGGAALALGILPRLASLGLIGALAPTTAAGHAFWKVAPEEKAGQKIQFLKNLAMIGGLAAIAGHKK